MRIRSIVIVVMLVFVSVSVCAQRKQIGEARTILKSGKDYDRAERLMTDLLKDSANRENKRIYEIWLQSVHTMRRGSRKPAASTFLSEVSVLTDILPSMSPIRR